MWDQWRADEVEVEQFSLLLDDLQADDALRFTPTKAETALAGGTALLEGFVPDRPLIEPDTRVTAMGSCFAAVFVQWLAENGFNTAFDPTGDLSLVRSPHDNPAVVAQQFRWAFGEFAAEDAYWIARDKVRFDPSEARRLRLAETLKSAEVLIITLGLTEIWVNSTTGEPIWRIPPREHREGKYSLHLSTVADCVAAFETIERLRAQNMPSTKIVYTVSPVRFNATYREMSPIVANNAGKSTLRAAVDEFLRMRPQMLNVTYFYFPAYEIIKELVPDPYSDNKHIHDRYAAGIVQLFAQHYTSLPSRADDKVIGTPEEDDVLRTTIHNFEVAVEELQHVADERLAVIEKLKVAADERLELVERLDAEVRRLKSAEASERPAGPTAG
jgi:hypothetical protein